MSTWAVGSPRPVETAIREKLTTLLQPTQLIITNESHLHRHHAAMRVQGGGNGETHFTVQVVSGVFNGKGTMQRHRMIYAALSDELAQGLHALSLSTKTPEEVDPTPSGSS
ncbi:bola-like protein-domain-containing protein [Scleroderma yunnanense]